MNMSAKIALAIYSYKLGLDFPKIDPTHLGTTPMSVLRTGCPFSLITQGGASPRVEGHAELSRIGGGVLPGESRV
jgi:hypothetical protein